MRKRATKQQIAALPWPSGRGRRRRLVLVAARPPAVPDCARNEVQIHSVAVAEMQAPRAGRRGGRSAVIGPVSFKIPKELAENAERSTREDIGRLHGHRPPVHCRYPAPVSIRRLGPSTRSWRPNFT